MAAGDLVPTYADSGYELEQLYRDFWLALQRAVPDMKVRPDTLDVGHKQDRVGETIEIKFAKTDVLSILGVQGGGGDLPSDVYISGTQIACRVEGENGEPTWKLLRADFRLLYLNALDKAPAREAWNADVKDVSRAHAGFRFVTDAGGAPRDHYPDCHAEYSLDGVEETTIKRYYRDHTHATWHGRLLQGQPYLPTAPMDFAALIYLFLHCHQSTLVRQGWPAACIESVSRLPSFQLIADRRSTFQSWWSHHRPPPVLPPSPTSGYPEGFEVPKQARVNGWTVAISGDENGETPHLTISRRGERNWRFNLRAGILMNDADETEVPRALMVEIRRALEGWRGKWNARYGRENPVFERDRVLDRAG